MAKFCLACGDPLGTRQLMHASRTCDKCRQAAAAPSPEKKATTGLLKFVQEVEARDPLIGTGKLDLPR